MNSKPGKRFSSEVVFDGKPVILEDLNEFRKRVTYHESIILGPSIYYWLRDSDGSLHEAMFLVVGSEDGIPLYQQQPNSL